MNPAVLVSFSFSILFLFFFFSFFFVYVFSVSFSFFRFFFLHFFPCLSKSKFQLGKFGGKGQRGKSRLISNGRLQTRFSGLFPGNCEFTMVQNSLMSQHALSHNRGVLLSEQCKQRSTWTSGGLVLFSGFLFFQTQILQAHQNIT